MEQIITSASNPAIKRLRKLASSSKYRREENAYIAEGAHLVKSFLGTGGVPEICFYAKSALGNPEVAETLANPPIATSRQLVIADSLFESITSLHAQVGIGLVFKAPEAAEAPSLDDTTVVLDDVQDPGNVGTILRTAAAANIKSVILSAGSASPWSPRALRAGMGAQFSLEVHENIDLAGALKQATIPVIATNLSPESKNLYELDLKGPVAWVFGSEGQGVSSQLLDAATVSVTIPQASSAVESLNVAAAAAICLYEQYRQSIF